MKVRQLLRHTRRRTSASGPGGGRDHVVVVRDRGARAVVNLQFCPFDVIAGFLSNRGLLVPGELVSLIAPHLTSSKQQASPARPVGNSGLTPGHAPGCPSEIGTASPGRGPRYVGITDGQTTMCRRNSAIPPPGDKLRRLLLGDDPDCSAILFLAEQRQ